MTESAVPSAVPSIFRDRIRCSVARVFKPGEPPTSVRCSLHLGSRFVARAATISRYGVRIAPDLWRLSQQIVPWASLVLAPRLTADGEDAVEISGVALYATDTVVVSLSRSAFLYDILLHEAWHLLETRLPADLVDAVDRHLGPSLMADDGEYLSDPVERRARAFEAWGKHFVEGLPGFQKAHDLDEVFDAALSGELGRRFADT